MLSALLVIGGICAPDTLGASHGEYLQQRIVLLGLAALVPLLPAEPSLTTPGRLGLCAMAVAWLLQTAFVWDYAFTSQRTAGAIARASAVVGTRQRVIFMLSQTRVNSRTNPLIHADGLLGAGTENILWNDYETRHYYFPVRFRAGLRHPDPFELEQIALSEQPDRRTTPLETRAGAIPRPCRRDRGLGRRPRARRRDRDMVYARVPKRKRAGLSTSAEALILLADLTSLS